MTIPREYEAAMLAYLAQLQRRTSEQVLSPQNPPEQRKSEEDELFSFLDRDDVPEEEKVYRHKDIDHLITVYHNQTGDEKQKGQARCVNGKGFNKADAPILTPLAEFYLRNEYLYRSDLWTVSRLIRKYHAQWGE